MPRKKAEQLRRDQLDEIRTVSLAKGQLTAATQATSRLLSLDAAEARAASLSRISKIVDPVARLRALADLAAAEGKWTAASRLTADAAELEAKADAERRAAAVEDLSGLDADEQLDILLASIADMSVDHVERIRDACNVVLGLDDGDP